MVLNTVKMAMFWYFGGRLPWSDFPSVQCNAMPGRQGNTVLLSNSRNKEIKLTNKSTKYIGIGIGIGIQGVSKKGC